MDHPHPDKLHVVKCYRRFILDYKRRFSSQELPEPGKRVPRRGARSFIHYKELVQTYLTCKKQLHASKFYVVAPFHLSQSDQDRLLSRMNMSDSDPQKDD
jgi:hypothetical protein